MEIKSSTIKKEAGPQPASLPITSTSATGLILMLGAFLSTAAVGAIQLLLIDADDKDLQKYASVIAPGACQILTAGILWYYKRDAKKKFRAYAESRMRDIDLRISNLPKKPAAEYKERLAKLEDKRQHWEDLLDKNEFSYIDAD